jgi:cobalt/nickel transport system permease protein
MNSIDYYASFSKWSEKNPALKAGFSVLMLFLCIGADKLTVSLGMIAVMFFLTVIMGGIPVKYYLHLLSVPAAFLIVGVIPVIVGVSGEPMEGHSIFLWGLYFGISKTSLFQGAVLAVRAVGAVGCLYFLTLSTPAFELIEVLYRLKLPKLFIELMSLIYRFIFVLTDTFVMMNQSAHARLGYGSLKSGYHSVAGIAGNLFIKSYKRAMDLYDAMEARCYDGEISFLVKEKKVGTAESLLFIGILIFFILLWAVTVRNGWY